LIEQRSKASGKSVEQLKQEATAKDGLRRLGKAEDVLPRCVCFSVRKKRGTSRAPRSPSMAARLLGITETHPEGSPRRE
jgi:hypothetical protein